MVKEPWVEKYRPKSLRDLVVNNSLSRFINSYVKNFDTAPHLLLYSKVPGTGKTSFVYALTNDLGLELLRLNASDERGIQTIREKVKKFVFTTSFSGKKKLCFLDEADYLTDEAQTSLRAIIEESSFNAKFIFACNYLHRIIEPIRSRCVLLDFSNPPKERILEYLKDILKQEKVSFEEKILNEIVNKFYPSIRDMVQECQRQFLVYGSVKELSFNNKGLVEIIWKEFLTGKHPFQLRMLWYNKVLDYENLLIDFVQYLQEMEKDLNFLAKLTLIGAKYNYRQKMGAHPEIQWLAFLVEVWNEWNKGKTR
jgi:replication factor C small subunit